MNTPRARVLVIYAGGTIGMVPSIEGVGGSSPLVPGAVEQCTKCLRDIGASSGIDWTMCSINRPVDSSDISPQCWLELAEVIRSQYDSWDGFVILHGTDTMAYTASALSFLCTNLSKPVVLTGSQIPITEDRSDARMNFANALAVAGYKATALPVVPEVVIAFGSMLLRGNRSSKWSASALNGFRSPHYPPLGTLGDQIRIRRGLLWNSRESESAAPFAISTELTSDVAEVTVTPGFRPSWLEALLGHNHYEKRIRGIVLRTFGAGNIPLDQRFLEIIGRAIRDRGQLFINVTQCPTGRVDMNRYAGGSALSDLGVISGVDMTPEAALTKLCCLLTDGTTPSEATRKVTMNLRGEKTEAHEDDLGLDSMEISSDR